MANNPQITDWGIYSGAFTWIATGTINKTTGLINNIYMAKIPYTKFAGTNQHQLIVKIHIISQMDQNKDMELKEQEQEKTKYSKS